MSRPAAGEEEVPIMIAFEIRPAGHPGPAAARAAMLASPGFGQIFTDHMITARWSAGAGWHDARLEPYGPFTLDPATSVFHYSQEFFEGLKAYRQDNGSIAMFRPDANAARFNASARRMAMPELPEETFIRALELLVAQDREWVPAGEGNSLYLRPFMIATQPGLGVNHPSSEYLFCVIASPAASYFSGGVKPVTVWLSQDYTRAAPGGTGAVKTGGNYAAAFVAQQQAVDRGCDQVVWLDAAEHRWVEEMGGMNLFFVRADPGSGSGGKPLITTPPLTGTLLPGITRDSLLRRPDRGVRLRDRGRDHPGGPGQGRVRRVGHRRRRARPGDHAPAPRAHRHPVRAQSRSVRLGAQGLLRARHPAGRIRAPRLTFRDRCAAGPGRVAH
jgi:branched-chain amino acid aminotransferase